MHDKSHITSAGREHGDDDGDDVEEEAEGAEVEGRSPWQMSADAERRWQTYISETCIHDGSMLLMLMALVMFVFRYWDKWRYTVYWRNCSGMSQSLEGVFVLEIVHFMTTPALLSYIFCSGPKYRSNPPSCRPYLYGLLVFTWAVYIFVLGLPPLGYSCQQRINIYNCGDNDEPKLFDWSITKGRYQRYRAARDQDCDMQGYTVVQLLIVFILLTPVLVPSKRFLQRCLAIFYVCYVVATRWRKIEREQNPDEDPRLVITDVQQLCIYVVIFVTAGTAATKKSFLDKGQRAKFVSDMKERQACEKIFSILEYMVPLHVIVPMLTDPGAVIADPYDRASILFVMFVNFDQYARSMPPEQLLDFLNRYFTEFDDLCARFDVTKIETVGEEYVCAVGVDPEDKKTDAKHGHGQILGKLIGVASGILALQDEAPPELEAPYSSEGCGGTPDDAGGTQPGSGGAFVDSKVEFKMGIHTGPVVAGVIGQKLPRFRLFGDTINTAARMMQKGLPGELQFGEETKDQLPHWVQYRSRGEIEMKGKGNVMTYLLDTRSPGASGERSTTTERHVRDDVQIDGGKDSPQAGARSKTAKACKKAISARLLTNQFGFRTSTEPEADAPSQEEENARTSWSIPVQSCINLAPAQTRTPSTKVRFVDVELPELPPQGARESSEPSVVVHRPTALTMSASQTLRVPSSQTPLLSGSSGALCFSSQASRRRSRANTAGFGMRISAQPTIARRQTSAEEHKRRVFEEVMTQVTTAAQGGKFEARTWFGGLSFSHAEKEESFQKWFHENTICKKLDARLERAQLLLYLLTTVEAVWFSSMPSKQNCCSHKYPERLRYAVYVFCRACCVLILMGLQHLLKTDWYLQAVREMQRILLASVCTIAFLIFVSYDALSAKEPVDEKKLPTRVEPRAATDWGNSSTISLVFVMVYVALVTNFPTLFHASTIFSVLAAAIMILNVNIFEDLYYSNRARLLFFVFSIVNIQLAWSSEKNLRLRFQAQKRMEFTRERIGQILNTLMPPLVVQDMREMASHAGPPSHSYGRAVIAQSDLVGFTKLASTRQPQEVVEFIGELFGLFDALTDKYEIYKVETVGDAYIAGQAEEPLTYKSSPLSVVMFGLEMVKSTHEWSRKKREKVSCRVGVHYGECIGGIVGTEMQRYHLFGELMTSVEVLESTAPEGKVQVSQACKDAVDQELRVEGIPPNFVALESRSDARLVTSKGEVHDYSEVGGQTYIVRSYSQFLGFIGT